MKFLRLIVCILCLISLSGCPLISAITSNSMTINNYSSFTIVEVYISPTSSAYWGQNQIYFAVYPGESATIIGIPDDCYDFLAEDDWGVVWEVYDICVFGGENMNLNLFDKKTISQSVDENSAYETHNEVYFNSESGSLK